MLSLSANHNPNYVSKIVKLGPLQKHPNADRLQIATVDFQSVIVGPAAREGDVCVFVPLECTIDSGFLSHTNSYRDKTLNANKEVAGFFEGRGRVRAAKLRGEKSMGYLIPVAEFNEYYSLKVGESDVDKEFDAVNDTLFCKKYVLPSLSQLTTGNKSGKKPKLSRLIDGQFHFHIDTEQLRKNVYKVKPEDEISITYKIHGSSGICGNVMVLRKLKWYEKILQKLGVSINDKEYDYVYASRRVVKNSDIIEKDVNHFYGYDIWQVTKDELKDSIPKGYTLYYEICGYTKDGGFIQNGFDYSCELGQHKIYVYRITFTNADGIVTELTTREIQEYCKKFNLNYVPLFYIGKAKDFASIPVDEKWTENFLQELVNRYTEKDCFMCKNKLPEEGIVLRRESIFGFDAYKLKSFSFLSRESEELDNGITNIEDNQS